MAKPVILVVDDEIQVLNAIVRDVQQRFAAAYRIMKARSGAEALEALRQKGAARKQVGLVLKDRGMLRSHQRIVVDGLGEGETTSGGYAPTLECSIALARVPSATQYGTRCHVEIRGKLAPADVVKPPFVRHGKVLI